MLRIRRLLYGPPACPLPIHSPLQPSTPPEGWHEQPIGTRGDKTELQRHHEERTSAENSSSGAASTALIVSLLLGCTVANPPETAEDSV